MLIKTEAIRAGLTDVQKNLKAKPVLETDSSNQRGIQQAQKHLKLFKLNKV